MSYSVVTKRPHKSHFIPYLKERFKIENKYNSKNGKDFWQKLSMSPKRIDEKVHTFSFYKIERGSENILLCRLLIYQKQNADAELEKKAIQKQTSLGWELTAKEQEILMNRWHFTKEGLKYNISLFRSAKVLLNLRRVYFELSPLNAKNRPAFLIGSLRKQISAIENKILILQNL